MTPKAPVAEGLLVENLLPKPGTASFGYLQPEVVVFRSAAHSARLYRDAKDPCLRLQSVIVDVCDFVG